MGNTGGDQTQYTFYVDDNQEGFDGLIIGNGIKINDGIGSFIWDGDGIAAGEYYIYGVITSDNTIPAFSNYSAETITNVVSTQTGLDIDGNGQYDALSDGTILTRYLFGGFEGDDLINGAIATNATRNLNEINAYLQTSIESGYFDIDGNGTVDALSDGIIAIRHLFGGFEGSALIDGAISPDATRNLAEIQAYLTSLTSI